MSVNNDPTLASAAVQAYRDAFHLTPNFGYRKDIIVTVTDMDLWKSVLANWSRGHFDPNTGKTFKWNPLNIQGMMQEYERRTHDIVTAN